MPIITQIKQQKDKKSLLICLDQKNFFQIDLENYIKHKLKVGKEIDQKDLDEIVKKAEFQKIYEKLLMFCMLRPRSENEIRNWLKRKKVNKSIHEELFNRLKRLDLVDDRKFAQWWIDQRIAFKPRGKVALYAELAQKGVDREVINEILSEQPIDEVKFAKGLIDKNEYKWKRYEGYEKKNKIVQFLARKGFNWETIKKALD